jgi:hypothetical protein
MAHQYFISGILKAGEESRPLNFQAGLDTEIRAIGMIRAIEERACTNYGGAFSVISFSYLGQDSEQGTAADDEDSMRIRL